MATAAVSAALAVASGRWAQAVAAGSAVGLLVLWLYLRVSAPINHQLTAAADHPELPTDALALQRSWDKVITTTAALQGMAVAALCLTLLI
jgi:hypothetical protein